MIKHKIKFFTLFMATVFVFAVSVFLAACGKGNGNGASGDNGNKMVVKGYVRTVSFETVQENIYYTGELKGQTDTDGSFEIQVPLVSDEELTDNFALAHNRLTYVQYDANEKSVIMVKLDEGMTVNDFYFLSGKMVLHSDGETVASGTELKIDGNTVKSFSDDGNFDIAMVHKNSTISAYKDGGEFVSASLIPYNNICFSDTLSSVSETSEITVNGAKVSLKHITGVTFRLNDIQ